MANDDYTEQSYWERFAQRRLTRRQILQVASLGAGLAVVGCGGNSTAKKQTSAGSSAASTATSGAVVARGGKLTVGTSADPTSLDPQVGTGGNDHTYVWTMHDNLTTYDDQFNPKPQLATKWEQTDPQTIVFTLRSGVKFHDGTDFDANAVKTNIERVIDPATKSTARGQILVVDSVEVPDATTAVFHLKTPSAPLILNLADRGGMMMSPTAIQKYGNQIGLHPVGTGSFKFVEWITNSHVTVQRNEAYWGKDATGGALPYLDQITWQTIPQEEVRLSGIESGQLDILDAIQDISYVKLKGNTKVTLTKKDDSGVAHMRLNLARPNINNVNLRRAMAWAIDRNAIMQTVHLGNGQAGVSVIGPAQAWAYDAPLQKQMGQDLAKAKQFLAAGGQPNGFAISAEIDPQDQTGQVMKEQLSKVGIQLNLDPQQVATKFYSGNDDAFITKEFSIRADPDGTIFEIFSSKGSYNAASRLTNGKFVADPKLDSLLMQAQQVYPHDQRAALYHQAEEIIVMDAHAVIWGWPSHNWALVPKVHSFVLGGEGKGHYTTTWIAS